MREIRFYPLHKKMASTLNQKVIYYEEEESIITDSYCQTDFTIMTGGAYIGLDINLKSMQLLSISGCCPKRNCIFSSIAPPENVDSACIFIDTKENWINGMGIYIQENNKIYYNDRNNWFCVGDKNINSYNYNVRFLKNAILCLKNNKFKALWFNPIFK